MIESEICYGKLSIVTEFNYNPKLKVKVIQKVRTLWRGEGVVQKRMKAYKGRGSLRRAYAHLKKINAVLISRIFSEKKNCVYFI